MKSKIFTGEEFTKAITRRLLKLGTLLFMFYSVTGYAQCGYINTVAGNGTAAYLGDGGTATSAELYGPQGVAVDTSGNIYFADQSNDRVRKVTASTGIISTVAGNGTVGYSGDGGAATSAELYGPEGVAVDASGNIYFADRMNQRIRKVTVSTGIISTVAGNGTAGFSGDGGPATSAELDGPFGVTVDASGNIYIADYYNNRIREVSASTGIISTVAGNGTAGYSGDGGAATSAELNYSLGLAVDDSGNIYIADNQNNRIRKVSASTGIISTVAGNGTQGYSGDGVAATSAELYFPWGVVLDNSDNIYIADQFNNRIRKVTVSTGIINTVAGNGTAGYSGDGGAATSAELHNPTGVAVDNSGNIYIADYGNNRIREVTAMPNLSITGTTTGCGSVTLTATGGTSYAWSGGSSVDSATNTFTSSGTYTVTATNNGCAVTDSATVTVNAAPTVNTITNQTVCAGDTTTFINFTGTGTGTVYNWTCNNTSIGLASSGTGNIGSFTAVNTGNTPVVAQVTVTPVAAGKGYAYITNSGSDSISVINTNTNTVVANITVGSNPGAVSVSPDGSKVFVTNLTAGTVSIISTATNTVTGTVNVGGTLEALAVSPDGSKVYVTNAGLNTVAVISTVSYTVTATIHVDSGPYGIAVTPDGSKVFVGNMSANCISVINTSTNLVIDTIHVGNAPLGIAVSPDGSKVYVANEHSGSVFVINTASNTVISTIIVGTEPAGISISPDGSKVYVCNQISNSVSVINTATNTVSNTISAGNAPYGTSITADGGEVYVVNNIDGTVSVINTSTNSVTDTIVVGYQPISLGNFITAGTGCTGTPTTFTTTVNPQPTAGITGTATACGTVSLTATGGTTYVWSGGSTPNTAANTFTTSNTYTVTVSNGGSCSATASKAVTVNPIPTATITPTGATTFCSGDSVILTASAGTTYLWSNTATTQSIDVKTQSNYTVVVGNANCSATSTATVVTVNALPNAAINGPTTICSGLQATLTASGGTGYNWSNGLGTNAQVNVQPTNNTTYTVTVSNANNCSATAHQTVTVTNTPTASISGATEVCSGNGITLTANGGNTYSWAGGLGSNAAITVSPTSTTTYTVTATIGVNCSASASQTVTVNQPASSQFSQSICAGGSYSFNNRNLTLGGAYYDTLQTIHTCDSIVTLNLTVNNAVQTTINDTTCKGTAFVFNGRSLNQAGVYKDTLQAASTCDSIITLSLVVDSVATPTITRNVDTLQTQSFSSYQWLRNGAAVSGTTQSIIVVQDGNYSVVVTGANGCSDTSAVLNVTGLGLNEIASGYGVKLYPNPNNGNFVLEFTDDVARNVEITDAIGRSVVVASKVTKQQNFVLDELAAGIYILRISEVGEVRSLKFSVVR